jgi:hypothetical protein
MKRLQKIIASSGDTITPKDLKTPLDHFLWNVYEWQWTSKGRAARDMAGRFIREHKFLIPKEWKVCKSTTIFRALILPRTDILRLKNTKQDIMLKKKRLGFSSWAITHYNAANFTDSDYPSPSKEWIIVKKRVIKPAILLNITKIGECIKKHNYSILPTWNTCFDPDALDHDEGEILMLNIPEYLTLNQKYMEVKDEDF